MKVLAAAVLAFLMTGVAASANAATLDTALGQYADKNGQYNIPVPDTLIVATASNPADKGAGFVVHITDLDRAKPGSDLIVGFSDAETWAQFVQLWRKAMAIKRTPGMDDVNVGKYFDAGDEVLMEVNVTDEGIELNIMGKDKGELTGSLFHLVPAQLTPFDGNVATVSAYFQK